MAAANNRGNPRGRGSGGPSGPNLLNLERVPGLAPKFSNQLGKTCTGFKVLWTESGMAVQANSTVGEDGNVLDVAEWVSIPEWERRRALKNAPSEEERISSLKRKYELRLAREFPADGPASGREEDIQAWLGTLPFAQRRALLMSQKDFSKSYPQGFRDPA